MQSLVNKEDLITAKQGHFVRGEKTIIGHFMAFNKFPANIKAGVAQIQSGTVSIGASFKRLVGTNNKV